MEKKDNKEKNKKKQIDNEINYKPSKRSEFENFTLHGKNLLDANSCLQDEGCIILGFRKQEKRR